MVGLHGGTGVMCKASGGTGAMVCYAISEGDVALAVGGCWAMGMGMRMPCHRWGYYCMWYGSKSDAFRACRGNIPLALF